MRMSGAPLLAALITTLQLPADASAGPRHAGPFSRLADGRFTRLVGRVVEDPNAQELGTLRDFVLDAPTACIGYAVVSSDGFLGLWVRSQALPLTALLSDSVIRGILSTTVTKAQWRTYPLVSDNLKALPSQPPSRQRLLAARVSGSAPGVLTPPSATNNSHQLASKLLGTTVLNAQHRALGKISDLFLDLKGQRPTLVVIKVRRFLHGSETFAAPFLRLSPTAGNKLVLSAGPDRLAQAPLLTDEAWEAADHEGSPMIYRLPGPPET